MAKTVLIAATITLMLVCLCQQSTARALARRDLIDGQDFLSLFIKSTSKESYTGNHNEDDIEDEIITTTKKHDQKTDESDLYTSKSNEINKPHDQLSTTSNVISTSTHSASTEQTTAKNQVERKQIVQFVTSGSKVVFLEELTPFDQLNRDQNSNDVTSETQSSEHTTVAFNKTKVSDQEVSETELDLTGIDASLLEDNDGHFDEDNSARGDFVSRSHKAELSVDFSDPVTHGLTDSMSSESNIHQTRQKPESQEDPNKKNIVPIQTVIYHDNFPKSMSAQPRSVSYASITQSVDQPNSWPSSESYDEARKNVSEVLQPKNYQEPEKVYSEPAKVYGEPAKVYGEPEKVYSEPAKVYSQPAKVYGQPAKFYSEPAKVYSEPSKVYSEPAKVYSEPAKVYSEPAKTYWPTPLTTTQPMASTTQKTTSTTPSQRKVLFNLDKIPYDLLNAPGSSTKLLEGNKSHHRGSPSHSNNHAMKQLQQEDDGSYRPEHHHGHLAVTQSPSYRPTHYTESSEDIYTPTPEQNYEVEESVSVKSNGRVHGIQPVSPSTVNPKEDSKVGYVFEGRNYRKYRVEEKTSDGFIVGEYGVVSHNDGSLRGVRYTADSNINPSLIHDALMKFLSL